MGLSYSQASANCNRIARKAYEKVIAEGGTVEAAQDAAFKAYETEMKYYES
jgi:hypothetical protein